MKPYRILIIGLMLIGMSTQAQKIYIRAGFGAAVTTAADIMYNVTGTYDSTSWYAQTLTSKKAGTGTGLPFVIAAGYKLSKNFCVELGMDYFYGFNLYMKDAVYFYSNDSKGRGQMLSLVPAFVMTFPVEKFQPYARIGLKLGVMNSVVYNTHVTYHTVTENATDINVESKSKDYGGIAIGVQAGLGTDYAINEKVSLFGEIQVDGISYSPKHGKYLEYSENGVDQMGNWTEKQKNWDYLKDIDYNKNIQDDQPFERPRVNYRFGNVGLIVGVKFNL
jgi:hypothetical protein